MKLLIAHDGSQQAAAMVADLPRCGLPASGQAIVLSVADAFMATADGGALIEAAIEHARRVAAGARAAVAAALPGWRVEAESPAGSPAWEVIRRADEWRPDLVMLGATGTSRLERLVFGTTTSQVVSHARCSVRVARPRRGGDGPVRIVLGFDGSEPSMAAVRHVASRTWPALTEVEVVTCVDSWLLAALESSGAPDDAQARRDAAQLPSLATPMLAAAGLKVVPVIKEGDPKRLLVEEADSWNADCIVVGARGRRGLSRLLLGSVALATASRARCSVEVVREDAEI